MQTLIVVIFASLFFIGTIHEAHAQMLPVASRRFLSEVDPHRAVPDGPNRCTSCHHYHTYGQKAPPRDLDLSESYGPPRS